VSGPPRRGSNGMAALPDWADLELAVSQIAATMRRYLTQIGCVLRPGSVSGADLALRSFAAFLAQAAPEVTSLAQVTRRHIEDYKHAVTRMINRAGAAAGLSHIHPHQLRHTLATQAINRGMSLEAIAAKHRSLDMTLRYAKIASHQQDRVLPVNRPGTSIPEELHYNDYACSGTNIPGWTATAKRTPTRCPRRSHCRPGALPTTSVSGCTLTRRRPPPRPNTTR
jgi:hypothetical protein